MESAKKYNPNYTIIHLTDIIESNTLADISLTPKDLDLNEHWLVVGRIAIVEFALKNLGFDSAIFIDGDTYTYNTYSDFQIELDKNYSLLVIPHITQALPEDGKYPQTRVICLAGNYNTGFWGATQQGLDFLSWWKKQTNLYPQSIPQEGLAAEQGWLRFAADFTDNVKVFKHPGYNVAYWNIKQRTLEKIDNEFIIDNHKLCLMHFSGLKKEIHPSQMSIFQNRYLLDQNDIVFDIFNTYYNLVWK